MANIQIPLEMEFDDNGEMTYNVLETHMKMEFQMIDSLPEKSAIPVNQSLLELIKSLGFQKKQTNTIISNSDTTVSDTDNSHIITPDINNESDNNIVILKNRENTKKSLNKTFKNIMKKVRHITYKNYQ